MAAQQTSKKGRGSRIPKPRSDGAGVAAPEPKLEATSENSLADPEKNWADEPDSPVHKAALDLYESVVKAFQNKEEQADACEEYWNCYAATPDKNQQYSGNAQGYIPAVRDCINARTKRALKQLFPSNQRHVEGLTSDRKAPLLQESLLEFYIRKLRLQSVVRTDLVAGDVTGQWNLMLDWSRSERRITKLIRRPPQVGPEDLGLTDDFAEEEESTEEEEIVEEGPEVIPIATEDLAVIPPTCDNLQKAKAVAIKLRLSKEAVLEMKDEGVFILPPGTTINEFCTADQYRDRKDPQKRRVQDAGVKTEGTRKYALIYMVFAKLPFEGKKQKEGIIFFAGETEIVGLIENPLWSGKRQIISEPVEKVSGSFWGKSKIEPVKFLQWNLNDFWNMGQDSAMYSLMPIWAVDPMMCPQWQTLTMGLAALWPVQNPGQSLKPMTQPQLWKDSAGICDLIKRQIWESMDVNEMMMGKMPQGRKNNQLMGAMQQEQMTNIMDHASRYEQVVLNPLLEMLFEFDQQFRTEDITIESRGEIGVKAALEVVPPQQWGERFFFRWVGTEFMQGGQLIQQGIALLNVLKGIPPQMLPNKRLDLSPFAEAATERVFGPELAPRILVDTTNTFTIDPAMEDEMMANSIPVEVHEADNDQQHLQSHMRSAGANGDPAGIFKHHMQMHMQALQKKREMAMAQQAPPQGTPGGPPGGGPAGVAGTPKPGAMPAPGGPRPGQGPAGMIPADHMMDGAMPGRG